MAGGRQPTAQGGWVSSLHTNRRDTASMQLPRTLLPPQTQPPPIRATYQCKLQAGGGAGERHVSAAGSPLHEATPRLPKDGM